MDNLLDLFDQTVFRFEQAAGVTSVGQCVWVYNRPVDIDGLRRFHGHLQRGRLARRIECSPLPFGRHRWVAPRDETELEIVATPGRAPSSTPGSPSRPRRRWTPSAVPGSTSRCSRSTTAAQG